MHPCLKFASVGIATLIAVAVPLCSSPSSLLPAIAQTTQDRKTEARHLFELGIQYYKTDKTAEALEPFQQALVLFRQLGDRDGEGQSLNTIGLIYSRLGQYAKALEFYQQALVLRKQVGDRAGEGTMLNNIGGIYDRLGQYSDALEFYQQALALRKQLGDRVGEDTMLCNIGSIYNRLGQYGKALEFYQQALAVAKEIGSRAGEGTMLNNVGFIYSHLGQYSQALEFYRQALMVAQEIGDRAGEGTTLSNIGSVYNHLGQYSSALEFYQQALVVAKEIGDRAGGGTTLSNIGSIYDSLGQYGQALEFYQQALAVAQEIGDRAGESTRLNNIGAIYSRLGQYGQALEFYQQALVLRRQIGDRAGEGGTLNNIGSIYDSLGQYDQALQFYQQALAVAQEIGDRVGGGTRLNNIGAIYNRLGHYSNALEFYQQALAIHKQVGDRAGEGATLHNIGSIYDSLGHYAKALEFYQQALAIRKQVGDRAGEGRTLHNIGYLLAVQNQPELAIIFLKQSVSIYEAIRNDLRQLPQEQQKSYAETITITYRRLADLLLKQDRVLEAQQIMDLLKVQELEDYLQNIRSASQELIVLRPEEEILKRYNELQKTAIQVGQELTELRQFKTKNALTPAQDKRLEQLIELEMKINQQFNQFIDSEPIRKFVEQLSRTTRNQNLNLTDLNDLRDNLKPLDAVLLYPLILDDRLELVITTPDAPPIRRTVQNLKRDDLNRVIADFRSALKNPHSDVKVPAQQLYQWLIKPIEADLKQAAPQNKPLTIIYAPDGQLRYVPLAALYDGQNWLVQRYRINNITAHSMTDFTRPPQKQLRIFAGAFGLEPRTIQVGTRQFPLAGLPFTVKEVQGLIQLIPGTSSLISQSFSRAETLKQLGSFNVIHLATHGQFVVGRAEESFIALGNGDYIPLPEIKDLTLNNVDLLVLSACETGIGDKLGNGEEILGLGYQFQRAGARAAIASLWEVDDGGTQALMDAFYAALKSGMTKAEALQQAQIALITAKAGKESGGNRAKLILSPTVRQGLSKQVNENLSHPYYWAPFILIGNGL
jgi:CHAT domain-containing protein/Tfp pilus assembly protein PilF